MLEQISSQLLSEWSRNFQSEPRPGRLYYLNVPGSLEGGTSTFLGFAEARAEPLFAVKVFRDPDIAKRAADEAKMLSMLQRTAVHKSVPRLLLCDRFSGVQALIQSIVQGSPMSASLTSGGLPMLTEADSHIRLAAGWLSDLLTDPATSEEMHTAGFTWSPSSTLDAYISRFSPSGEEVRFIDALRARLSALTIKGRLNHGDFCRHNLLVQTSSGSSRLSVIDWTDSRVSGNPLHDILFFVTTYFLQIRPTEGLESFLAAFRSTFSGDSQYAEMVRTHIVRFCDRTSIPLAAADDLFALFLIERALFEAEQIDRCARRGVYPRFRLYLAARERLAYAALFRAQIWPHFFLEMVRDSQIGILCQEQSKRRSGEPI